MWNCENCKNNNPDQSQTCLSCGEIRVTISESQTDCLYSKGISEEYSKEETSQNSLNNKLAQCYEYDSTADTLNDASEKILSIGKVISIILGIIAFIYSAYVASEASRLMLNPLLTFFGIFIPGLISVIALFFSAWLISLFVKAQACVVQNTRNSARILEFQARLMIENKETKLPTA